MTPTTTPQESLREKAYSLASEIVEFEFHDPRNRHMSSMKLKEIYSEKLLTLISKAKEQAREELLDELEALDRNEYSLRSFIASKRTKENPDD